MCLYVFISLVNVSTELGNLIELKHNTSQWSHEPTLSPQRVKPVFLFCPYVDRRCLGLSLNCYRRDRGEPAN